ncbi:MAG: hypothetical protein KKC24_18920 [Gammaproteobacteria bacterium]|uniref:hypothetical protein n=1 Tax=Pseudomonas TaxID=286 RepID=UPI000989AFC6|nr:MULTISPECIES: hypothetical protein [Pseudomonas]MBU0523643.1 hypothetical protein [Gammaproteobacteria bacterium]MBS4086654.1 hypothetical protein [Pseudomonas rustica]MBU0820921.1 hypothetical protein [Gammaproteobacteria bacterium]MBU0844664.1 hypothetical protein [Gammaproteobacteria bacterium]MBU1842968.1 hypothetical protein [Gammaproteobacteria bacterium]
MFDITSDDINQLNDIDLRELVGRLCEAELMSRELSPAAVTWGGNQTAADGGLDVRVELPPGVFIEGFIPRGSTGFQVKKPDMPRSEIISEMRPMGTLRPVIQELADEVGAYVIVSSTGSTADSALRNRRGALRAALNDVANADQLHTDFYDRTRLATWVRCYPGLITWVKERVGKALSGWRPYGPWSGATESVDAEYLLDDKLRLHLGRHRDAPAQSVAHVIDELRDELAQPGKIVRLVGLSGVGKTRLVQALFDSRVGARALPPSLAVYTNLSDNPDPQPTGLASDLIANRMRAVLIVDNCPSDLHRRLSDLCNSRTSTISVLTVEYDIRDDQPEGTQVVTLDTSSLELIETLLRRRYLHLSEVDAHTIAETSGGNARIAVALAETVERSDTIAGLSNEELFQRLFRQRQDPNDALLLAAQACSLVYSFQGEALVGEEAELPRLASLAGQLASETYRHVGELTRRDLVQQRGVWRAVLPHAIANRLAARALDDTPFDLINQQLVEGGTERLARSFSRRLSFLHDHPKAVAIVERWLVPDGLLGDVTALNDLGRTMFENVASVQPDAALAALERAGSCGTDEAAKAWRRYQSLLRSFAYDSPLFERSTQLLTWAATQNADEQEAKEASDTFTSLFTIYLSGTHATLEQRLGVIERLLIASDEKALALGLAALEKVLEATHFGSHYQFEFGARSRDYGYEPRTNEDAIRWYRGCLAFVERLALAEAKIKHHLRDIIARSFRGLWTSTNIQGELGRLFRWFAADGFWREGWAACRETMYFDSEHMTPEAVSQLSTLEDDLKPSGLSAQVRAFVLGNRSGGFDFEDLDENGDLVKSFERMEVIARQLGTAVADDDSVFAEILPDLLRGGNRTWSFGRGLAGASSDPQGTWGRLIQGFEQVASEQRDVQVLCGFLAELWEKNREIAQHLLNSVPNQPQLLVFLPRLLTAVGLDEHSVDQLKRSLTAGKVPVQMFLHFAYGRVTDHLAGGVLKDLLVLIADQPDGFDVALEVLSMRLFSDRSAKRELEPELIETGRELLQRIEFRKNNNQRRDRQLSDIVKVSLTTSEDYSTAAEVSTRFLQAIANHEISGFDYDDVLAALLECQPAAVLDSLFSDESLERVAISVFYRLGRHRKNPADRISCDAIVAWCERDRGRRYPLIASIVTFACCSEASDTLEWSEQAKSILTRAPDPRSVLEVFIKRFRPMSWSGSRASIMDANAQLLGSLELYIASDLMPFVSEAQVQLAQEVARARQRENEDDRVRDERFE